MANRKERDDRTDNNHMLVFFPRSTRLGSSHLSFESLLGLLSDSRLANALRQPSSHPRALYQLALTVTAAETVGFDRIPVRFPSVIRWARACVNMRTCTGARAGRRVYGRARVCCMRRWTCTSIDAR